MEVKTKIRESETQHKCFKLLKLEGKDSYITVSERVISIKLIKDLFQKCIMTLQENCYLMNYIAIF